MPITPCSSGGSLGEKDLSFSHSDSYTCFLARRQVKSKSTGTKILCAPSTESSAEPTVYTASLRSSMDTRKMLCRVFLPEAPPFGTCKNFLEAVAIANNAHLPSTEGRSGAVCCKRDMERLSTGSVDKLVLSTRVLPEEFKLHTNALTLTPEDRSVQLVVCNLAKTTRGLACRSWRATGTTSCREWLVLSGCIS